MREKEFVSWLTQNGMKDNSAGSRLKNCLRICKYEGDLDVHYERDRCRELMSRLKYSRDDEFRDLPTRHNVPISGDVYNGTATLRAALKQYIIFRNSQSGEPEAEIPTVSRRRPADPEHVRRNIDAADSAAKLMSVCMNRLSPEDLRQLADRAFCRENFHCDFPILDDITARATGSFSDSDGRSYSGAVLIISGRRYTFSDGWYQNPDAAVRERFTRWLDKKLVL